MIGDWLLVGLVVVSLWAFWLWLGALFDAIADYYHGYRQAEPDELEDAQATRGTGSSEWPPA